MALPKFVFATFDGRGSMHDCINSTYRVCVLCGGKVADRVQRQLACTDVRGVFGHSFDRVAFRVRTEGPSDVPAMIQE